MGNGIRWNPWYHFTMGEIPVLLFSHSDIQGISPYGKDISNLYSLLCIPGLGSSLPRR